MKQDFPERKKLRLEHYNYSSAGAYFVTIRIKNHAIRLSEIKLPSSPSIALTSVGDGALDVPHYGAPDVPNHGALDVPHYGKPLVQLTETGKIIEKHLLASEKITGVLIDQYVIMPDHIHVIVILTGSAGTSGRECSGTSGAPSPTVCICSGTSGAPSPTVCIGSGTSGAPSPTEGGIDCVKGSGICQNDDESSGNRRANEKLPEVIRAFKRFCNREIGCDLFQRSYIEHIIRDKEDYLIRKKYIHENPARWLHRNSAADR